MHFFLFKERVPSLCDAFSLPELFPPYLPSFSILHRGCPLFCGVSAEKCLSRLREGKPADIPLIILQMPTLFSRQLNRITLGISCMLKHSFPQTLDGVCKAEMALRGLYTDSSWHVIRGD